MTETVTPKPNKRTEAKAVTRAQILDTARMVFSLHGYEATTIRVIAQKAGLSTGSIFASWMGKAELYTDAVGHPPVTPEIGRQALRALQAFQVADALVSDSAHPAYRRCYDFAESVLQLAKLPAIAAPTGSNPTESVDRFLRGDR